MKKKAILAIGIMLLLTCTIFVPASNAIKTTSTSHLQKSFNSLGCSDIEYRFIICFIRGTAIDTTKGSISTDVKVRDITIFGLTFSQGFVTLHLEEGSYIAIGRPHPGVIVIDDEWDDNDGIVFGIGKVVV